MVTVGFLAAIPYVCAAIAMMLWARRSDAGSERSWFVAAGLVVGAASLVVAGLATSSALVSIIALCGAVVGIMCYQSTFWANSSSFLTGSAAAGGLALIVLIGNLGGFVGPFLIGAVRESTGSFAWALIAVAGFLVLVLGAILIRVVGTSMRPVPMGQPDLVRT